MKKYFFINILPLGAFALISWGVLGHKTVASIAENHLDYQIKKNIESLLGGKSIIDLANSSEETASSPYTKDKRSLHYLRVPAGLTYEQFEKAVKSQDSNNLYGAIMKFESDLQRATTNNLQKENALKSLINLVADAHQPSHTIIIDKKKTKSIPGTLKTKNVNIDAVWDNLVITNEKKSYVQLAKDLDTASVLYINTWEGDYDPMFWLYESYQISSQINSVDYLNETNEQKAISIVQRRIEMAGIRLAGTLNKIFNSYTKPEPNNYFITGREITVKSGDLIKHIGDFVVTGGVVAGDHVRENGFYQLDIANQEPNKEFIVLINPNVRKEFLNHVENYIGKFIVFRGKVTKDQGKPELIINSNQQINQSTIMVN